MKTEESKRASYLSGCPPLKKLTQTNSNYLKINLLSNRLLNSRTLGKTL